MSDVARQDEGRPAGATLAVELVTEELPPKALKALGASFAETLAAELKRRGLLTERSDVTSFATPRRLAVAISHVAGVAPDSEVIEKLMPVKVAFDANGMPTQALRKKLASMGREHLATSDRDVREGPDHRYEQSDGKADYVFLRTLAKGQPLARGPVDTVTGLNNGFVRWSPDGKRLAGIGIPGNRRGYIWIIEPLGLVPFRKLADLPPDTYPRGASWSTDGHSLIFGDSRRTGDIVMAERRK